VESVAGSAVKLVAWLHEEAAGPAPTTRFFIDDGAAFGTPDGRPPPWVGAARARRMRSIDELEWRSE
jgi:hypothetical protein